MRAKKKYQSGGKVKKTVGDIHDDIRNMRSTKRQNSDGTVSTHLMSYGGNDEEGYYVMPTIFPNSDGSWLDPLSEGESDENWDKVYQEAKARGEVISGLSKEMAEDISSGSWKGPVSVPRKNIKFKSGGKVSSSTKYYQGNPEARKKKNEYNKKYHSTPSRRAYRAELNQKNREAGTYGNGDGKDYDHTEGRFMDQSRNRAKDRPVKKAQNGMYLPPKIRSMQEDYINPGGMIQESTVTAPIYKGPVTANTVYNYNKAVGNPTSVHALKHFDPIFDLVGGLAIKAVAKSAPKAFELSKSALNYVKQNPTFVGKHLGKIIGAVKAADNIYDIKELTE